MKIFVSWSGARSRVVAEAIQEWVRRLIQSVEPWISTDIEKGKRWSAEVAGRLGESRFGIICLTRENLESPWIHFEVGALSKTLDASVWTLLLDLPHADVGQPLSQFQHTLATQEDMRILAKDINSAVERSAENALSQRDLDEMFDLLWPRLQANLDQARAMKSPSEPGGARIGSCWKRC